jgi:hypothetical protein
MPEAIVGEFGTHYVTFDHMSLKTSDIFRSLARSRFKRGSDTEIVVLPSRCQRGLWMDT